MAKRRIEIKIVIVYGLLTNDYSYLALFYPSLRFTQECQKRSIQLRFLFPKDVPLFLAGMLLPAWSKDETVFLIRGKVESSLIAHIEAAGYRCVNSSTSTDIATDKLSTAFFLQSHGFPTPNTVGEEEFFHSSTPLIHFPVICKPRFGSRGKGVCLVNSLHEARSKIIEPNELIFQNYIQFSHGRDIRIFFCDGIILACVLRQSSNGSLLSNVCAGSFVTKALIPKIIQKKLEEMSLSIAKKLQLQYGSIDYLYTAEKSFTICEINSSPGFEALERSLNMNIADKIVTMLIKN